MEAYAIFVNVGVRNLTANATRTALMLRSAGLGIFHFEEFAWRLDGSNGAGRLGQPRFMTVVEGNSESAFSEAPSRMTLS